MSQNSSQSFLLRFQTAPTTRESWQTRGARSAAPARRNWRRPFGARIWFLSASSRPASSGTPGRGGRRKRRSSTRGSRRWAGLQILFNWDVILLLLQVFICAESILTRNGGGSCQQKHSDLRPDSGTINLFVQLSRFLPASVLRGFACGPLQGGRLGEVVAGRGAPARMAFVACFCICTLSSSFLLFETLVGLFPRPEFEWEPGRGGRRKRNYGTHGAEGWAADRRVLLHTFEWSLVLNMERFEPTPRRPALISTSLSSFD
jgi:hypothetical protein